MLKKNILRKKRDFSTLYNRGKSIGERYVVIFYKRNNLHYNRIGILASKKIGNAVCRNRARRLIRESLRLIQKDGRLEYGQGWDLVFIARKSINGKKCQDVRHSIERGIKKAGLA